MEDWTKQAQEVNKTAERYCFLSFLHVVKLDFLMIRCIVTGFCRVVFTVHILMYIFFMGDLKNTYILGKINPKKKSLAHANIFKVRTTAFGEPCVHCED